MIRIQMTPDTAQTLSSFLFTAAERFKEDARVCRDEAKRAATLASSVGLNSIALQFDKQESEARAMAEQFSDEAHSPPATRLEEIPTITLEVEKS